MKEEFNFDEIKTKALEQLKSGKSLLGKEGTFAPLLESILNAALEGEMDAHMDEVERSKGNRRNGYMPKQVQTPLGEVTVHTPRIGKVTKNKGVFTNDTALEKLVYLAYRNIRKKWTMPLANWGKTAQQLAILYPDRFKLF